MHLVLRRPSSRVRLAAVVAGAVLTTALAPLPSAAAAGSATTVLTLTSTAISGIPASVPAGYHTFVLKESAAQLKKDPRGLDVLQLSNGYTTKQLAKDVAAAFADKYTPAVKKVYTRLLKNTASLGGVELENDFTATASSFTVLLKPGTYILDNGASDSGAPDSYKSLTVTAGSVGAKPKTVGTVTSKEFAFKLVGLRKGKHVYALHNAGAQIHMYQIFRLDKGHTLADVEKVLGGNGAPPAWFHNGGFAGLVSGGQTMYTTLNLSANSNYLLICFMPDVKTGTPHFLLGMVRFFRVT